MPNRFRGIRGLAQQFPAIFAPRGRPVIPPKAPEATHIDSFTGLFGRPGWTYMQRQPAERIGPFPRLAQGSGQTGASDRRHDGSQFQGFLSDNNYQPNTYEYLPPTDSNFMLDIPRTINYGTNGRELVGTYNPHDFIPVQRFFSQMRSSAQWQQVGFPPDYRNLIAYQQVARYNLYTQVAAARPLDANDYFLGYRTSRVAAGQLGGNGQQKPLGS